MASPPAITPEPDLEEVAESLTPSATPWPLIELRDDRPEGTDPTPAAATPTDVHDEAGEEATSAVVQAEQVTVEAETLFGHLVGHEERISYASAYLAMLGSAGRPWRSVLDVPMVLRAARATATRNVDGVEIRLDALIVNKKTQQPGSGHFRERPYAEEEWLERFARWSMCGHTAEEVRAELGEGLSASAPTQPSPSVPSEDAAGAPPAEVAVSSDSAERQAGVLAGSAGVVHPAAVGESRVAPTIARPGTVPDPTGAPAPAERGGWFAAASAAFLILVLIVAGFFVASSAVVSTNASPNVPPDPAPGGKQDVVERFDAFPIGTDPGWQTSRAGQDAAVGVAAWPTSIERSVRLKAGEDGQPVTACRSIAGLRSGVLDVEARISLDGLGATTGSVMSINTGGNPLAALGIGPAGELAAGAGSATVAAAISPGVWYDVAFAVDAAGRSYRTTVSETNSPRQMVEQAGSWTSSDGSAIDRICFTTPAGVGGRSLYISELRVAAR